MNTFKAGFVSLLGMPNAGKSTLLNALIGEPISIITPKAHTTRQHILGILTTSTFQIVFSDTPGLLSPTHPLQRYMEKDLRKAFTDTDLNLLLLSATEKPHPLHLKYYHILKSKPLLLLLNKSDTCSSDELRCQKQQWQTFLSYSETLLPLSAKCKSGLDTLLEHILPYIPSHPPYFPFTQLTDKSKRFIAEEVLRKHALLNYRKEIPYHIYTSVHSFRQEAHILHIEASVYTARNSQKAILIGHKGQALKRLGTAVRKELERFFHTQIFLHLTIKVAADWMKKEEKLREVFRKF